MLDSKRLATDAAHYGCEIVWRAEPLNVKEKNTEVPVLTTYPLVIVRDASKFLDSVGREVALHFLNASQSPTVKQQGALRSKAAKSLPFRHDRAAQVATACEAFAGVRASVIVATPTEVPVYTYNGATYKTAVDAAAAMVADLVTTEGYDVPLAQTIAAKTYGIMREVVETTNDDEAAAE